MKKMFTVFSLVLVSSAIAHVGGHGPKLQDSGNFGGILASVIAESEIAKGSKASIVYKAELVRSDKNDISVFIYDSKMKLLPIEKFSKEAKAQIEFLKDGKYVKQDFSLHLKKRSYEGVSPKPESKPFNIDVHFSEGGKKLFVAFDDLD